MGRLVEVDICSDVLTLADCGVGKPMDKYGYRQFFGVGLPEVNPLCFDVGWESQGDGTYKRVSPLNYYCIYQLNKEYRKWLSSPECPEYEPQTYTLSRCVDRFGGAVLEVDGVEILSTHPDCVGCAPGVWGLESSVVLDFGYSYGSVPDGTCVVGEGAMVHSHQEKNGVVVDTYVCEVGDYGGSSGGAF